MIRSLYLIIVTMAIANTLAAILFGTWLVASDRLDAERVGDVREMFSETVTVQRAREEREARDQEAQDAQQAELDKVGRPPISSAETSVYVDAYAQRAEQQLRRLQQESRDRQETLFKLQADIQRRERALEQEREAFERMRAEIAERAGTEQFAKALKVYENLPPEETAAIMQELVQRGEEDQAVAFLDAMKPRIAGEVTSAILADNPGLAADLLERLREYGVVADVDPEEPG